MDTATLLRNAAHATYPELEISDKIIAIAEAKLAEKLQSLAPAIITRAILDSAKRAPKRSVSRKHTHEIDPTQSTDPANQ